MVAALAGCSWGWRSIMWGLDLSKQRIAWRLGDGETITVFDHQWISECDNPYRRMGKLPGGYY